MRVLFVSPVVPWPPDSGGRIRTARLVEQAARRVELDLFCVGGADETPHQRGRLAQRVSAQLDAPVRVFARSRPQLHRRAGRTRPERWFSSAELEDALREALRFGAYDLVHLDELNLVRSLPPAPRTPWAQGTPAVVHHHKLDRELLAALPTAPPLRTAIEQRKLARLEALAARRHHDHLVCCDEDAARLGARYPHLRVGVVPNGFDPRHFEPLDRPRAPARLLFLGTLSYGPNVEGLRWFVHDVLPLLQGAAEQVELDVVGRDPGPPVRALAGRRLRGVRVNLIGGVDDVRPWLAGAAALVAPLNVGGGTRLKVVEALAMGTPVIATPTAAEGLALEDRVHLDLATEPAAFAQRIRALLDDPGAARARAERGGRLVTERYTWERLAGLLLERWSEIAHQAAPG